MKQSEAKALLRLFDETSALFHRLRAVAEDVHGHEAPSAGRRGILRSLDALGPQTVPQLARARPVSRQHIQVLVNGQLRDGLVRIGDNPAHRKSPLVCLTDQGKLELESMQERERKLLERARLQLTKEQIDCASNTLCTLRRFLESSEWRRYVANNE